MSNNTRSHRETEAATGSRNHTQSPRGKTTLSDTVAADPDPGTPTRKSPMRATPTRKATPSKLSTPTRKATPSKLSTPARKTPSSPSTAQSVPDSPVPRGRPTFAIKPPRKNTKAVGLSSPVRRSSRTPIPIDRYTDPWIRKPSSPSKREIEEELGKVYELSANMGAEGEQSYNLMPCARAGLTGAYVILWGLDEKEGVRRKLMLSVWEEPEKKVKPPKAPKSPAKRKVAKKEESPKKSKPTRKLKVVEKAHEEHDDDEVVEEEEEEMGESSKKKKAMPKKPRSPVKPKALADYKGKGKVTAEAESLEKEESPKKEKVMPKKPRSPVKPKALADYKGKGKVTAEAESPEKPKAARKPRYPVNSKVLAKKGEALLAREVEKVAESPAVTHQAYVEEEDELSRQEQKEKRQRERRLRLAGVKPSWYSSDPDE